jgi:hypothetical protein
METLKKHEGLQSRLLKSVILPFKVKVVGNAVPASKVLSSDLAGVAIVVAQGQTSAAPAGVSYVAPDDATGKFSVILDKAAIGALGQIVEVSVVNITATHSVASSISNDHIVLDVDSSADLSAANCELRLIVHYLEK